jgi:hypothetical protein
MAQFNTTELDFDKIKGNLKDYFKRSGSPFQDWDFDGSGLNNLLDVLSYNTHYNSMNTHVAMNESFLDSAQIRSNVVSRAKLLGYTPTSKTAATADITLVLRRKDDSTNSTYTINRGDTFTSTIDDITYTFVLLQDSQATVVVNESGIGTFTFNNLLVSQGSMKSRKYNIDNSLLNQKFVIQDRNADISTLLVKVYDTPNASTYSIYNRFKQYTSGLNSSSLIYYLEENYAGKYEIHFGNDIIGKQPGNQSVIELEFLSTRGDVANGASAFSYSGGADTTVDGTTTIIVNSASAGGSEVEDIESIRFNAPLTFIAQNRAVTTDDYKTLVKQAFGAIDSISVWGGEDNNPQQFGRVFISVKPEGALSLTREEKTSVTAALQSKRVLAIEPVVVDPDYTYLFFNVLFKYNSNFTSLTQSQMETGVRETITRFNESQLQNFDGVFRYSQFLREIDSSNTAILNSTVRVYAYKDLVLTRGSTVTHKIDFDMALFDENPSQSIIQSTSWKYNNADYFLADEAGEVGQVERNIYIYTLVEGVRTKVINSVGTLDVSKGEINLRNSQIPLTQSVETIRFEVAPDSNDIVSRRNTLLRIDVPKTSVNGEIDTAAVSGSVGDNYNTYSSRADNGVITSNTSGVTVDQGSSSSSSSGSSSSGSSSSGGGYGGY